MQTLIVGYGNADRQDDGVAWHVIQGVISALGFTAPLEMEDESPISFGTTDFLFLLQLTPELSATLTRFDRVCFVDAHTGRVPEDVHFDHLQPGYQHSPFTHHLTPNSLLAMTESIYHKVPDAILISVRGYEFGFSQTLSNSSYELVPQAIALILTWLNN